MMPFGKLFFVLLLALAFSLNAFSQELSDVNYKSTRKVIHSFGIYMNNGIYLPEKIYEDYGLIKRIPRANYGYEFAINYNPIVYKGLGLSFDLILFGNIPHGHYITSGGLIKTDTLWFNGFPGDPTSTRPKNGTPGLPYFGFNIKFNYLLPVCKHLLIQPEIGVKLPLMPSYGNEAFEYFCDSNVANCVDFYYHYLDNQNNKRTFFPDLLMGVNFFIYAKNPKHCIKVGLNFNYGFVPRLQGFYEVANIGTQYDSGGKVKYGSTHFGISIGYQFVGVKKNHWVSKKDSENYLFNPRY